MNLWDTMWIDFRDKIIKRRIWTPYICLPLKLKLN